MKPYLPFHPKIELLNHYNTSKIVNLRYIMDLKQWKLYPLKEGKIELERLSLFDQWEIHPPTEHKAHNILLRDVVVCSQSGIVQVDDNVIDDTLHHTQMSLDLYKTNIADEISLPKPEISLQGCWLSLLFANQDNYYHFLLMNIGRLFQINDIEADMIDGILIPMALTDVQYQAVQLCLTSIFQNKPIEIKRVDFGESLSINKLFLPWNAVRVDNGNIHSGVVDFFRKLYLLVQVDGVGFPTHIYIDRRSASNRPLLNEDELIDVLQQHGFTIVQLEYLTFEEQILLFHHAQYVVGAHGAGLSNIVFCQPETKVVEIMPHTLLRWCYRQLAMVADLPYDCVISHSFSQERNVLPAWAEHSVNVQNVLDALNF